MYSAIMPENIFFKNNKLDKNRIQKIVDNCLHGFDDGELFLEFTQSEKLVFDDGILKDSSFNTNIGFGLRSVIDDRTGYAYSSLMSEQALLDAASTVQSIKKGFSGKVNLNKNPHHTNQFLYEAENPIEKTDLAQKIAVLKHIDAYLRKANPLVKQVSASLLGSYQTIEILKTDSFSVNDIRPLVRLNISVTLEKDGRMENGFYGCGGRSDYTNFITEQNWQKAANEALRQALVNLESSPTPAGQIPAVLGPGWPGILLHEAIGHGLEGDFNRKKTSAFSGLLGQKVATDDVTVIDDGTIANRRGSLIIDDEGTPSKKTILIEKGILKNYMQDRLNARLMKMEETGNGRRESYEHMPLPRMTNTYMLNGKYTHEEIIESVKYGIYAANFGGGQVDITSGKFVFSACECYLIENGKITRPIKGATLIGNGPDALTKIKMIGNNMQLDPGIGTCGKAGQGVPVGVGQPSMLIEGLTVGGTEN